MIAAVTKLPTYDGTITVTKLICIVLLAVIAAGIAATADKGAKLSSAVVASIAFIGVLGVLVWYA